jgi:hypothetical protein
MSTSREQNRSALLIEGIPQETRDMRLFSGDSSDCPGSES